MYKIKQVKKGWVIERSDGSYVNEIVFRTLEDANAYLDRLRFMGFCT